MFISSLVSVRYTLFYCLHIAASARKAFQELCVCDFITVPYVVIDKFFKRINGKTCYASYNLFQTWKQQSKSLEPKFGGVISVREWERDVVLCPHRVRAVALGIYETFRKASLS